LKFGLQARTSALIFALILVLVALLSAVLAYRFDSTVTETQQASKNTMAERLFEQKEKRGKAMAVFLAESLSNYLYFSNYDLIEDLASSTRKQ
jgi:p-aminobenzoyl-glutamate transporter AbgT